MTSMRFIARLLPLCFLGGGALLAVAVDVAVPVVGDADWQAQIQVIDNGRVRVAADALHGGRLVAYALAGRNALYTDPAHPTWVYPENHDYLGPAGGRVDIGPEETLPTHRALWSGAWAIERVDPLHLRMTSPVDTVTGVQLIRDVALDPDSTHLRCTQTMRNITDHPLRRAYWGRSLSPGGGIFVTGLSPDSRFPKQYIQYSNWPDSFILMRPSDPAISIRGGYLVMRGAPQQYKIGLDTRAGWLAYLMRNGLLFVKRFSVYPERRYADIAGLTICVWSFADRMVELEPLGPEELLAPGQSASFSEDWWLLDHPFPETGDDLDPVHLHALIDQQAVSAP